MKGKIQLDSNKIQGWKVVLTCCRQMNRSVSPVYQCLVGDCQVNFCKQWVVPLAEHWVGSMDVQMAGSLDASWVGENVLKLVATNLTLWSG